MIAPAHRAESAAGSIAAGETAPAPGPRYLATYLPPLTLRPYPAPADTGRRFVSGLVSGAGVAASVVAVVALILAVFG